MNKDIAQACRTILEFIDSCPSGATWVRTPTGELLVTDWGYVIEGLEALEKWARNSACDNSGSRCHVDKQYENYMK